jgi:fructoselysine-6-P-deglycase FrlB-like protein
MNVTYEEMKQQYTALRKTFDYMSSKKGEIITFYRENTHESITYIGCGSSYCLCQSAQMSAKVRLGIPSTAIPAGDLMLNHKDYDKLLDQTMIITLSRSGSTSEVIKAIEAIGSDKKIPLLAITCIDDSPLEKISDFTLKLPWAFDESVCQTRTIVNLYAANLLITAYLSYDSELENAIDLAIDAGDSYMAKYEDLIKPIAERSWTNAVILADGEMQGIAAEGALALTEIAKIPGRSYHLLDVRHGPMVLVDKDTLVIACLNENGYEYQKSLVKDIAARGAKIIIYSSLPVEPIEGVSLHITSNIKMDNAVSGIPFIFIPQVLAIYRAAKDGINPDNPEGLTAWIKL